MQESERVTEGITNYFDDNNVDITNLKVAGCDGEAVNTGYKTGVLRRLEEKAKKPIQRAVCQLHLLELPLRHLFASLDGPTRTPTSFSGPIGKLLTSSLHTLPLVEFDPITCEDFPLLDDQTRNGLSSDQRYLYSICCLAQGLDGGNVANLKPGKLAHSRWCTTASRILRLFVSTLPTKDYYPTLRILAEYVVRVYFTTWLDVKRLWKLQYGAIHVFQLIRRSRYMDVEHKSIIDKVIETNFYSAHSESLLLAMYCDESKKARAIDIIKQIRLAKRSTPSGSTAIREFKCPKIQFSTITSSSSPNDYDQLLDLSDISELHEPPLLLEVDDDDLEMYQIEDYPTHTQAVERCIQLVSQVSKRVIGSDRRTGMAMATMISRQKTGKVDTKKNYTVVDKNSII